jgi:tRNA threonylcarbamoyladenosine biosynthesis protein TsaB
MKILAINTAQAACDIALHGGQSRLAAISEDMAKGQDARLPELVGELLAREGLELADLTQLAVCIGPGSFTGVRIGVAYARGLAAALGIPCTGVTSLEACIAEPHQAETVRIALQAQKRPPDITFWTQLIEPGERHAPEEWPLDRVAAWSGKLLTDRPDLLAQVGDAPCKPTSESLLFWARQPEAANWLPSPAYVRAPDAAMPGGGKP